VPAPTRRSRLARSRRTAPAEWQEKWGSRLPARPAGRRLSLKEVVDDLPLIPAISPPAGSEVDATPQLAGLDPPVIAKIIPAPGMTSFEAVRRPRPNPPPDGSPNWAVIGLGSGFALTAQNPGSLGGMSCSHRPATLPVTAKRSPARDALPLKSRTAGRFVWPSSRHTVPPVRMRVWSHFPRQPAHVNELPAAARCEIGRRTGLKGYIHIIVISAYERRCEAIQSYDQE